MDGIFGNFLLLGVLIAIAAVLKKQLNQSTHEAATYEPRKGLFTSAERSFLGVLEQAVGEELRIFGKVRLGDMIQPAKGLDQKRRTGARNRINQKHVDFVLCRPNSLEVAAAIELDDSSHRQRNRAERDKFVDRALSSAGITMIRFPAKKGYVVQEVKAKLAEFMLLNSVEKRETAPEFVEASENMVVSPFQAAKPEERLQSPAENYTAEPKATEKIATPNCPACNSEMVKRQAKRGKYTGNWFWACSEYPKCRKILALEGS